MKKLTKIKLINWHLFVSQTIEIKDNILISGENGSGKSTLLDALQYVLIGEKNGVKFNIAANDNAKRSLESYIKGKIGIENKEFLRNKDVITHISLEFYDSFKKEYTLIGCVLELSYIGFLKESFYLINGLNIQSDIFVSDNKPKNSKEIRDYFRNSQPDFDFFDTKKQYHVAVGKYLQINISKYLRILPKALAFKPLDLQKFIFNFLLEEQPIKINSLKNSVQQLKKIETQIELEQQKLKELSKIIEVQKKIQSLENQIKINLLSEKIIYIKKSENNLENLKKDKQNIQKELSYLSSQKSKYKEDIEYLNDYILKLQTNKNKNDLGFYLHSLQKDLKQNEIIIEELKEKISFFQKKFKEEINILDIFATLTEDVFIKKHIKKILHFFQNSNDQKSVSFEEEDIQKISNYLSQKVINLNIEQDNLQKEMNVLKRKIDKNDYELQMINQNFVSRNDHFTKIARLLKEKLNRKYNKNIFLYPLCELIEIKDELWRNAIEGFLGLRKFNLIIDYRYFDSALKIYDKLQDELKIYDIGLVNVEKIPVITDNNDSLASHISSDNPDAFKYVKILLSHIKCELNIENLKKHKTAITPEGMMYSNYTAKKLNPKTYKIPYIGLNSFKIRKDIILDEINIQKNEMMEKRYQFNKNTDLISLINKSKISFLIDSEYLTWFDEKEKTEVKVQNLKEKIEQLNLNTELFQLEENINKLKKEKQIKDKELDGLLFQIADKQNKENIGDKKISYLEEDLIFYKKQLSEEEKKEVINIESATVQFHSYMNEFQENYELIFKNIKDNNRYIEKQRNDFEFEIISLMKTYLSNYHLIDIEAKLDNFNFFVQEYNLINSKNLIQYEQEAKELSAKTEIIFKEEFINKLKESILEAKQQIKNLNKILKNRPFGNDSYEIIAKPSDDPEYKKYYFFFVETDDLEKNNFSIDQNNSYQDILINELFQKIISFEQEYENIYYAFLDYRNYLSYDIKIYNKDGNFSFFSKIFREKSGGETQVPFYIIMSICFEQLLIGENKSKGCLVFFDEAFNNMDEARIEAMMSFYDSLNIQFIIAVPPQRIVNVLPYTKTNLIVIKENNFAIIENFIKEI
ncbi:ATP-binding protein ['Camptotheca acuminata' phytoplasma]|uniref:ATP-binding protein n=1 Tax='Camptotheca acuminata' phytoplasma TaxID=3239192 RepID=UPI003519DD83